MSAHFDDDALRAAYEPALRDPTTTHGPDCPSETALLAAVRGEGSQAERLRVLDQATKCPVCRREMALLHAVSVGAPRAAVPAVRNLSWRRWTPVALAASLVLAVGLASVVRSRNPDADEITRAGGAAAPALVSPDNAAAAQTGPVRFVWRPMDGVIQYTLEVVATDGTVVVSALTRDTVYTASLPPAAVGEHRWLVRAKIQDGGERRSESRVLRVR